MKKNSQANKTAAELMAELNADPEFVARQRLKREALQEKAAEWRRAEAPVIAELRQVGENVESVWDLVSTTRRYPRAIPVLLKHLGRTYPERVREGIARALAVPDAKVGWSTLVELFRQDEDQTAIGAKQAIGSALAAAADDDVLEDVIALVRDKRHGANRLALLPAIIDSSDPKALELLEELKQDVELSREVRRMIKVQNRRRQRCR